MECPRGSSCSESTHTVKTLAKGIEWCKNTQDSDLPLRVEQLKSANGRLMVKIYNKNGELLESRG